jgi:hypothetical protein
MKTWTTGWILTEALPARLVWCIMPHDLKLQRPRWGMQNTSNQLWRLVYWSVLYCSGLADSTLTFGRKAC